MNSKKTDLFPIVGRLILVLIVSLLSYIIGINDGSRDAIESTLKYHSQCRLSK